jgi:tRNA G18 (ribose-2'-O)-methylase SpoU
VIVIDDPKDPRVADYVDIREAHLVKRRGVFLAEGTEVVRTFLTKSPLEKRSVLIADRRVDALRDVIDAAEVPVYVAAPEVMNRIVGFDIHRGCLAAGVVPRPASPHEVVPTGAQTVLFLEGLANHDNVGQAFRNAAAFGVGAVWLDEACADPLYRKAIRTSMGAALTVPFARARLEDLDALEGFEVVAMSPAGRDLAEVPRSARTVVLVGTEGAGLSAAAMARADHTASIPMAPGHDSLNVATAAAIALYTLTRPLDGR